MLKFWTQQNSLKCENDIIGLDLETFRKYYVFEYYHHF